MYSSIPGLDLCCIAECTLEVEDLIEDGILLGHYTERKEIHNLNIYQLYFARF